MKKGSFVSPSLKVVRFHVEDIEYRASEFGVHCTGFGSLVIEDSTKFSSLAQMQDNLPEAWIEGIMEELHHIAREQSCDDRNEQLSKWDAWRELRCV